jgi:3-deoxy-7-phosphoheptulonate synthase
MLVIMSENATEAQTGLVVDRLANFGLTIHCSKGVRHALLGTGGAIELDPAILGAMDGVKECYRILSPYQLASRQFKLNGSIIKIGSVEIGGPKIVAMAGPCSVESEEQIELTAEIVASAGVQILRGGAFKPRTSPYSFQGLGERGLQMLRSAADRHSLRVISEVMDQTQIGLLSTYADILQVGSRNMHNFNLLRELGKTHKPILLKRGFAGTIEELLLGAEYIMSGGNYDVMLCERGIRTFETSMRNTMDIAAIAALKRLSHLPVIADPSHGTGNREYVVPMARAAIAAGADGLLVEVHPDPDRALTDGAQTLCPDQFCEMIRQTTAIAAAIGRAA